MAKEKTKVKMSEEKTKRIIVSSTVGAVLLAVILIAILIYQLIAIVVEKREIAYFEERIAVCDQLIAQGGDIKEAMSERKWIIEEARKHGYILSGEKILGK